MTGFFIQAFIYLIGIVVMVPLARRLGLGSVLGYLLAGVIIGPVAGWVGQEANTVQHFAEFGVVMMLFLVGLELEPKMLWQMKGRLFGLGGSQVLVTGAVVGSIAWSLGQAWQTAVAIGCIFALSSTAIVLQTLNEKNLEKTEGGRSAFSVLLFQDIAVIPMLALLPLLALPQLTGSTSGAEHEAASHNSLSLVASLPPWAVALVTLGAVAALILASHYLSRPLFRYVARSGLREAFTATALMVVIGIAALMSLLELSPALGTFLAGVVLANSEFRHELEANIEPFKGLLLGIFFITVGAGINVDVLFANFWLVMGLTLGLMLLKGIILLLLGQVMGLRGSDRGLFTLSLAQAGEFGFVLITYAVSAQVLPQPTAQLLSLVVALSMFLTPALFIAFERLVRPRYQTQADTRPADTIDATGPVIIAGLGRFGQIVNRLLIANGVSTVVLDHQADQVDRMRRVNIKSYYGDASRPDLLETAGIAEASLLVIAINDRTRALAMTEYVKQHYPQVKILARAYDRGHQYELREAGADVIVSETYNSALWLGGEALQQLGLHPFRAEQLKQTFSATEWSYYDQFYQSWKTEGQRRQFDDHYRQLFMQQEGRLLERMKRSRRDQHSQAGRAWVPPPSRYYEEQESE